jgi:hypothetical protein
MSKIFRLLVVYAIGVACAGPSIAWAQTYITVDYPGALDSSLNGGPNPQGDAVGSYDNSSGVLHGGFVYKRGSFIDVNVPQAGPEGTIPFWITPLDEVLGEYYDQAGAQHGFILRNGHYSTVDYPGAASSQLSGSNIEGEMVGEYCHDVDCNDFHSFIRTPTGQFIGFDPPGATTSWAATVNLEGAVVGVYFKPDNTMHGYLLYRGRFTTVDFPGAVGSGCGGNNAEGDIVGWYVDHNNVTHGFLLRNGHFNSFDFPGATLTEAAGINSGGIIVGVYIDTAGHLHGYMRKPGRKW